mmetsp:Transcript_93386/g.264370  ORF Transcript_93386/g.264370 Transcript_93386/m.264370 type:complete len:271 (-) Transcript_93386:742-1554(-)
MLMVSFAEVWPLVKNLHLGATKVSTGASGWKTISNNLVRMIWVITFTSGRGCEPQNTISPFFKSLAYCSARCPSSPGITIRWLALTDRDSVRVRRSTISCKPSSCTSTAATVTLSPETLIKTSPTSSPSTALCCEGDCLNNVRGKKQRGSGTDLLRSCDDTISTGWPSRSPASSRLLAAKRACNSVSMSSFKKPRCSIHRRRHSIPLIAASICHDCERKDRLSGVARMSASSVALRNACSELYTDVQVLSSNSKRIWIDMPSCISTNRFP